MATTTSTLPAEMKALIVEEKGKAPQVKTVPTPSAVSGSCVVKVLAVGVEPSIGFLLSAHSPFTFPRNLSPGGHAVGRVAATGPDTTLAPGQLVMLEPFLKARDDPDVQCLWGLFDGPSPASKKLMADNWAQAACAEYVRAPLEMCHRLDEARLCGSPEQGGLGYSFAELTHLPTTLVALGGLNAIGVRAGERVIVAPATGAFSGAAVEAAVALGASVIAMGRNMEVLKRVQAAHAPGRIQIVQNTGDVEKDTAALKQWGPVDAYLDLSPVQAGKSTHVRSCFLALRQRGRAVLMGVIENDLAIPYTVAVWNSLTIKGQYMYERDDARHLIQMTEAGVLKLGKAAGAEVVGTYKLEDFGTAFETAAANNSAGKICAIAFDEN